jgi:hypothetical protein
MADAPGPQKPVLTEEATQAILETLKEQLVRAKRITTDPANDESEDDAAWRRAAALHRWWWYPKCPHIGQDWDRWLAFARRRGRFAWGLFATGLLSAVVALGLPEPIDRWMFVGNGIMLALAAAWQLDISNRELETIETCRRG